MNMYTRLYINIILNNCNNCLFKALYGSLTFLLANIQTVNLTVKILLIIMTLICADKVYISYKFIN